MQMKDKFLESNITDTAFSIEVGEDYICGTYYDDFSGEICITDDYGDDIFFKEDGTLKQHVGYLRQEIKKVKKEAEKKLNHHIKLYKRAIVLLEKNQAAIISQKKKRVLKARNSQ